MTSLPYNKGSDNLSGGSLYPSNPTGADYMDKVPPQTRGYIHTIAGAAFTLLMVLGYLDQNTVATIAAVAVAAIDLVLVLIYTRSAWRMALYPLLYGVGGILSLIGTFNEVQITAIIGLALAVLGTQYAAAKTPVVNAAK